jgi:nucleotide-binding universal stress UspA family protein
MHRILLPVDGSEASLRAVDRVQKIAGLLKEPAEILLLNVQQALRQGVTAFVSPKQIDSYHHDEGIKALAQARAKLDAAKVPHQFHIGVGDEPAEVIAHYARDKKCDQVVMGTRGLGSVAGVLLGSVTTKVIHLVDVPVLLVK